MFIKVTDSSFTALLVYIDDILVATCSLDFIDTLKVILNDNFKIKNLSCLRFFLKIEMARSSQGIHISQCKYALEILANSKNLGSEPIKLPIKSKLEAYQG